MTSISSSVLLQNALHTEIARREAERNQRASELAERDAIVAKLHAGVRAVESQLTALSLRGDYDRPVRFTDAQEHKSVEAIYTQSGIKVALGPSFSPEHLTLTIVERSGATLACAYLRIERRHPNKSEEIKQWNAHASTDEMLAAFFAELAKRVVDTDATARA